MLRSVFDEWKVNLKTTLPCNHHLDPWCVFFIVTTANLSFFPYALVGGKIPDLH